MILSNKKIRNEFLGGRILLSAKQNYTINLDIIEVIPTLDDGEAYQPIAFSDFVDRIAQAAYERGVFDGEEKMKRDLKKLLGI